MMMKYVQENSSQPTQFIPPTNDKVAAPNQDTDKYKQMKVGHCVW